MEPNIGKIVLKLENLRKYFPVRRGILPREKAQIKAVNNVSLDLFHGQTVGLVGESGCGKSTLGRTILRLIEPTSGKILFYDSPGSGNGFDLAKASKTQLKNFRHKMQIIFQDPYSSLNPRMKIGKIIGEPLILAGEHDWKEKTILLMQSVGLNPEQFNNYPHEFSGGQRQRIGIARALALKPMFIVADEPVSALDVSIRLQILGLLREMQKRFNLTYLFISHDLSVIKILSHRIAVMYLGGIVELAETEDLFYDLKHPYTEALIAAMLIPDPDIHTRKVLLKEDLHHSEMQKGCRFFPRCGYSKEICEIEKPVLQEICENHLVACHFAEKLTLASLDRRKRN
jgi:peptide/nickel transport system ATP-binding protein